MTQAMTLGFILFYYNAIGLVAAIVCSIFILFVKNGYSNAQFIVNVLLRYILLFVLGVQGLLTAVFLWFYPQESALLLQDFNFMQALPSICIYVVFAVLAIFSFFKNYTWRFFTILTWCAFVLFSTVMYLYLLNNGQHLNSGYIGNLFYTQMVVAVIFLILLYCHYLCERTKW